MRLFFHRTLLNFKSNIGCQTYPRIQISHIAKHGVSRYAGLAVVNHNLKSQFFATERTKSLLTMLIVGLFNRSLRGCYVTVILNSLNYFIKEISPRRIRLHLHFAKKFILPLPPSIIVRTFKRRVSFFGLPEYVMPFVKRFTELRPYDVYTGYGVRVPYSGAKKKPGKLRIR